MYKYDFYGFLNIGERRHSSVGQQKLRRKTGKLKEFEKTLVPVFKK